MAAEEARRQARPTPESAQLRLQHSLVLLLLVHQITCLTEFHIPPERPKYIEKDKVTYNLTENRSA